MGPSGHFYSCIGLVTQDIGIPHVDGLSMRHFGIWGVTYMDHVAIFLIEKENFYNS